MPPWAVVPGSMRTTSPWIQSSPEWMPYSTPRVAMSCMPTQMPRKGLPRDHRALQGIDHARHAIEAGPAVGEGADARQYDAIGVGHFARARRHQHAVIHARLARGASKAFAAERRLPDP